MPAGSPEFRESRRVGFGAIDEIDKIGEGGFFLWWIGGNLLTLQRNCFIHFKIVLEGKWEDFLA